MGYFLDKFFNECPLCLYFRNVFFIDFQIHLHAVTIDLFNLSPDITTLVMPATNFLELDCAQINAELP